jgi:hypothetical protein
MQTSDQDDPRKIFVQGRGSGAVDRKRPGKKNPMMLAARAGSKIEHQNP